MPSCIDAVGTDEKGQYLSQVQVIVPMVSRIGYLAVDVIHIVGSLLQTIYCHASARTPGS